jgi:hypothetical protein
MYASFRTKRDMSEYIEENPGKATEPMKITLIAIINHGSQKVAVMHALGESTKLYRAQKSMLKMVRDQKVDSVV